MKQVPYWGYTDISRQSV